MPQTAWHDLTLSLPLSASYPKRKAKAATIKAFLSKAPPGASYSETSLNFITQFADVVVGEFRPPRYRISVVKLERHPAKVLHSMIAVGYGNF